MVAQATRKNFCLFLDGRGYAGECDDFTPPKLGVQTEDFRAGGMDAPIAIDMGMEKLTASFSLKSVTAESIKTWGVGPGVNFNCTVRCALENYTTNETQEETFVMTGRINSIETESVKAGSIAGNNFTMDLIYYKYSIGGVDLVEIDVLNMKRVIGGSDRLASIRKAIGL